MYSYEQKKECILSFMEARGSSCWQQFASTFDEEFHDIYHEWFPQLKLKVYTIGPNICPDANRTLLRMWKDGLLRRSTIGNQDARAYMQPTYCHVYYLPGDSGHTFAEWCERNDRTARGGKRIRFKRRRAK